jgi:RimJ/RimL family protein N-acetyltransferase
MFFRSERLFLRPGWPEDWSELFARIADEGSIGNVEQARRLVAAADARLPRGRHHPQFLITVPSGEGARLAGCIGLSPSGGAGELGIWIAPDQRGRGYATEAARALLSLARTLGHQRVHAACYPDDPATGRILRKIGFAPTGAMDLRFSITRGGDAAAEIHAIDLGNRSDCDGSTDRTGDGACDDGAAAMRAA